MSRIREKAVDLVVNIHGNKPTQPQGNFLIRRAASDFAVPLLTNVHLLEMLADALEENARAPMVGLHPTTLFDFYAREKPSEAWTHERDFH
jgi:carbamoyl-phosphate synthase (ammonia)